ncbi:MAG: TetR/AcrR family transcriptional regulator, partial [Actinomycetes bacterium]
MKDTLPAKGRPRDLELEQKILAETFSQLSQHGYAELRIEPIARAVGCGKATIYRWWPEKSMLTADALLAGVEPGELPDTGSLLEDLIEQAATYVDQITPVDKADQYAVWTAVLHPKVRELVLDRLLAGRRRNGLIVVARGVARGELPPDTDAETLLDLLAGLAVYRSTFRILPMDR